MKEEKYITDEKSFSPYFTLNIKPLHRIKLITWSIILIKCQLIQKSNTYWQSKFENRWVTLFFNTTDYFFIFSKP